jgi:hypothetical protein
LAARIAELKLSIEPEPAYCGQAQFPFGYKIGPGPHCRDSRPASWPIPLKPEPSKPRPSKPKPCKPNPPKLEPSKPKPRKPKPPRFNAKPNKSGTSEKSSPPNEDPRLKEVPPQSNGCSPPNRELPNRAAFGPVREWECEEWPNAELPNREFPEFGSPPFASSQDEAVSFGVLPREDSPQLREADTALGGRFGLKEDGDLGVLAPED